LTKLNLKYVSEVIGEEYKQWNQGDYIIIDSQTGTGKSNFIINKLKNYAESNDKSILYICNRINLKDQIKTDLFAEYGITLPKDELRKMSGLGSITVTSYQKITTDLYQSKYNKSIHNTPNNEQIIFDYEKPFEYDYIVFDEAHYVFQDASFNEMTDIFFFDYMRKYNNKVISIFISATMDNLKGSVIKFFSEQCKNHKLYEYSTGRDYSYVDTFYFKHNDDIINTINNDTSGDKWLIFIDSNTTAITLLNRIKGSKFVCAEDNNYADHMCELTRETIIEQSFFECKCLIATKALDNGVNIKDPRVKHIVIISINKVDFIQFFGRKRIDINNPDRVNLYIKKRDARTFQSILNLSIKPAERQLKEYRDNKLKFAEKYDRGYHNLAKGLFYVVEDHLAQQGTERKKWEINRLVLLSHLKLKDFCENMIKKFKEIDGNVFIREQLSWIGGRYMENNWIANTYDNEELESLEQYLDSIVGHVMLESKDRNELINKINLIDTHNSNIKNNNIKLLKNIDTLNSYLNEINSNFTIKEFETSRIIDGKKKKYKSAWKIMKLIE